MDTMIDSWTGKPDPGKRFIQIAIEEALKNYREAGEHPVGAVLVHDGEVVAQSGNRCHLDNNPLAHAEMIVMQEGCRKLGRHALPRCTLYSTHEPCPMCAAAAIIGRLDCVIWGTSIHDAKAIVSPSSNFRIHPISAGDFFNGGAGTRQLMDEGLTYVPGKYRDQCLPLLRLCSEQRSLPLGEWRVGTHLGAGMPL